jgi:DNA helicase-2/ATP-dependent DNA helicase PcrA
MTDHLLKGLNPPQRDVVLHHEGPLLAAAVAGAGKTTVLVKRMAYLMAKHGVDGERILAVTFSRKGADEMNERLAKIAGKDHGARVGTFHSLAYQIVREEIKEVSDWTVDSRNKYRFCIKDATGYKCMKWKTADVTQLEDFIAKAKTNLLRPSDPETMTLARKLGSQPSKMVEAYYEAEELRRKRQLLTFDDMLLDAVELLRDDESIRVRWAQRWDFVLQDEAQDQNLGQLLMGELLAKDHRNYMLVGDPAQTIYTWRGAHPEKLLTFEDRWGAKVILMDRNYRCGQTIIDVANATLGAMDPATKLEMTMQCCRKTSSGSKVEGVVTSRQYLDLDDEAEHTVLHVQELIEDGFEYKDIVFLYRTNAQSRAPEEALLSARIPYRIIGGCNFYERREVKQLLGYLRLASGRGTIEDVRLCINAPFRFLGRAFVDKVVDAVEKMGDDPNYLTAVMEACNRAGIQSRQKRSAADWGELIREVRDSIRDGREYAAKLTKEQGETGYLDTSKPARLLELILQHTRYTDWLRKDEGEETTQNNRVSNVRELVRAAERFPTVDELLDYIDRNIEESKKQRRSNKQPNKVTLMSIHRSKGMEFPVVFLIGASEAILPHARTEDLGEEQRLFYVAATRARDELHVSAVSRVAVGDKVKFLMPSRFLSQANISPIKSGNLIAAAAG